MSDTLTISELQHSNKLTWKESYLAIYYNAEDNWIYIDWTGPQTPETIMNGCEQLLRLVTEKRCHKLITDLSHTQNLWQEAVEWVSKDFAPRLNAAGINYIAWIYAEDSQSGISADAVLRYHITEAISIVFDSLEMAETWLRSV